MGGEGILVGKTDVKRPLGRPRRRCEDSNKMDRALDVGLWTGSIWLRILTGSGRW
jgi:hypothetical protein